MSVHGTVFLLPMLSAQQSFPKLQQSVATEAPLDPQEIFLFLFPFETQMWVFLQLFSTSPPVLHNPSSLSPSWLTPPLGTSPDQLPQALSGSVFASPPKNTQSDSIHSGRHDNARKQSFCCCIAKPFCQRSAEYSKRWGAQKVSSPLEFGKWWCAFWAALRWFAQPKPFPLVSILQPKKSLTPISILNCAPLSN